MFVCCAAFRAYLFHFFALCFIFVSFYFAFIFDFNFLICSARFASGCCCRCCCCPTGNSCASFLLQDIYPGGVLTPDAPRHTPISCVMRRSALACSGYIY